MDPEFVQVIGFDLGHGDTAIARVLIQPGEAPKMLEINGQKKLLTSVARHSRGDVLIGEPAINTESVVERHLGFKGDPLGRPGESRQSRDQRNETVRTFVAAVFETLESSRQLDALDRAKVCVGCPSGWSDRSRMQYIALLTTAGIPHVDVIAESRAAFVHAKNEFTVGDLQGNVLIIDIGSSTTDFTLIHDCDDEPIDFGLNTLGAALIEESLLRRVLDKSPDLRSILEEHEFLRPRALFYCRQAKEEFFCDEQGYAENPYFRSRKLQQDKLLTIEFDHVTINEILDEPRKALGNKSWRDSFRFALAEVRDLLGKEDRKINKVILTGGPSRMQFTCDLAKEMFSEASISLDSEPEFCIAKGLAAAGMVDILTDRFMREVNDLSSSGVFRDLLNKKVPILIERLADPLATGLIDNALRPGLQDWYDERIQTLEELEQQHCAKLADEWIKSEKARVMFAELVIEWIDGFQEEIHVYTSEVCRRHGLPSGTLRFDMTPNLRDVLQSSVVVGPNISADVEFVGNCISVVIVCVVASFCGGTGTALIMTGPIGLVIGGIIGGIAALVGRDRMMSAIKQTSVPGFRTVAFLWKPIEARCSESKPAVIETVRSTLLSNRPKFDGLIESVLAKIREELHERAKVARVLIGATAQKSE